MLMQPWNPGPIKRRSPLHDHNVLRALLSYR